MRSILVTENVIGLGIFEVAALRCWRLPAVLNLILMLFNSLLTGLRGQVAMQTEIIALRHQRCADSSQEQLDAACGEARDQGLRAMIHTQSAESMIRAARARCTAVEHGVLATKRIRTSGCAFEPRLSATSRDMRNWATEPTCLCYWGDLDPFSVMRIDN